MKNITLIKSFIYTILLSVTVISTPAMAKENTNSALEIAFQKEFAFLDQQMKAIVSQTSSFISDNKKNENTLQIKLDKLKNKLISLDLEAESKQAVLEESNLSLEAKREDQARLNQLFEQATASLSANNYSSNKSSLDKSGKEENTEEVAVLYRSAIEMLNQKNTISRGFGEYFMPDGEKVSGTIVEIGRVASYAIGESGSGMLVPAGDGKLKLWNPEKVETANAFTSPSSLASQNTLNLFLYEDKNQTIEESIDKSIMDIVNSGGIIAWVIVFTGGIAIVMVLLRIFFLNRASKGTDKLMMKIKDDVRMGKVKEAIAVCEKQRGAAARVVTSILRNLDRERDHLEDIVAESILHENAYLNRYGAAILVVAAVAPLMGLLGTVTGMIETFDIITQFGTGDPKLLSVGISTALVTTQLGLIVAIPALVAGNLLSGWSNKIKDNMEQAALQVINLHGLKKFDAANDENVRKTLAA